VALYDTLGPDATRFVCNQTAMTTICVSADYVSKTAKLKLEEAQLPEEQRKMHKIRNLIVFDDAIAPEDKSLAKQADLTLHTMEEVIFRGREAKKAGTTSTVEPKPEDVYMFSYTSGTTGDPKGVKLTHKMMVNGVYAMQGPLAAAPLNEEDCYISYLPAAHAFEQALFASSLVYGVRCGFFAGNVLKLTEDVAILKPTLFPSVPRLYNRIYGKLQAKIQDAQGVKGWLVQKAVDAKLDNYRNGYGLTHSIYDKLVFNKMKAVLGGNVRVMITASAPIAPDVLDFLKICFCVPIVEGYGMTESGGGATCSRADDRQSGHVGGPVQNVKIRLRDLPELQYYTTSDPPRGEICFYGSSLTPGYFLNPEKTKEALHDGWLWSGDVGRVNPDGSLTIIDRVKNIFKTS